MLHLVHFKLCLKINKITKLNNNINYVNLNTYFWYDTIVHNDICHISYLKPSTVYLAAINIF